MPCPGRCLLALAVLLPLSCSESRGPRAPAVTLPIVTGVAAQPLRVLVGRLVQALEYLREPLPPAVRIALDAELAKPDGPELVQGIQSVLDPLCLVGVRINPESRVSVQQGPGSRELVERAWRATLVKVHNEAGVTARMQVSSPEAFPLWGSAPDEIPGRWLEIDVFDRSPLEPTLSGLELEYRIVLLYSRDAGERAAVLSFDVGQGTQELGFRGETTLLFQCLPSRKVLLRLRDERGAPTVASVEVLDEIGRVYPSPAKRLAPDFVFHPQVYRSDRDELGLGDGRYLIVARRGPEYEPIARVIDVGPTPLTVEFDLQRWIDPSSFGWWSGDHHVHAGGCAHYQKPTDGFEPPDLVTHLRGEDLKIGCALAWAPCFAFQSRFFSGDVARESVYPHLLRYDVEVSGFGSHESGHLCLLRLREQTPPGARGTEGWPTLCLNTLRWAKRQGAVTGFAHTGLGLLVPSLDIPHHIVPPYDGVGAAEYIVDVTHTVPGPDGRAVPAIDFLSMCSTTAPWELTMWYHTLNCGFRTRAAGETDFPCLSQERIGAGRSYVHVEGNLDFDRWCDGLRDGRSYVSDGRSHLIDFTVGGRRVGTQGSELRVATPRRLAVTAQVAARLPVEPPPGFDPRLVFRPFWHLERARIAGTRRVPVELIVDGRAAARTEIEADGTLRDVRFEIDVARSSWIALRILPSSHTNPVFVIVGGQPIRASRASAEWCRAGVEQCWSQKERFIAPAELADAIAAYDHAREVWDAIVEESPR